MRMVVAGEAQACVTLGLKAGFRGLRESFCKYLF